MQLDLSLTITGVIALSAILSPIIVTIVNNKYQFKLKKFENYEIAKIKALENFCGAWGEHYCKFCGLTEKPFLNMLYQLIPYFDVDLKYIEKIKGYCHDKTSLSTCVDELLTVLKEQIKPTNQSLIQRIFHKLHKQTNRKSS